MLCTEVDDGSRAFEWSLSPEGHGLDLHTVGPIGAHVVQVHMVLTYTHTHTAIMHGLQTMHMFKDMQYYLLDGLPPFVEG